MILSHDFNPPPHAGGDCCRANCGTRERNFNPRLPCGRRRWLVSRVLSMRNFNPRLPCGRRPSMHTITTCIANFNPRLPCGRRRAYHSIRGISNPFQSPPPMREATTAERGQARRKQISIPASHAGGDRSGGYMVARADISIPASHAGGDLTCLRTLTLTNDFNPRLPCGRRRGVSVRPVPGFLFQSPPPMREATRLITVWARFVIFQSPPPMREATATYCVAHYIFTRYSQIS